MVFRLALMLSARAFMSSSPKSFMLSELSIMLKFSGSDVPSSRDPGRMLPFSNDDEEEEEGDAYARHEVMSLPDTLPKVDFMVRVRDESIGGDNPFKWVTFTSEDYFKGKKVVLFSLPGAFTPTCSTYQLPGFEKNAEEFKKLGIDEIYCLSVNDSFVMNKWAQAQDLKSVKVIPDGSLKFTNAMNMNVQKDNHGFGQRSWRYAVVANDMKIEQTFVEPGKCENGSVDDDPYGASSPENILKYLKGEDFDAGA
uniref:Glutaredoxin-dependent peroxiredoxin n=1 Tax=Chloropicon primus TaxID=1764295 RepID=A0A7S2SYL8_9CHLO|mmetsp:Transcript_12787/g.35789  ORF Transcript_12787/g.35789 Transcript_12787/m.35789 type:complete len:253 (+) Transcript_12787:923-1681(+)